MNTTSPYDALDLVMWRRLLAQAAMLQAVAGSLMEFHLGSLTPGHIQDALSRLRTIADDVSHRASTDAQAVSMTIQAWRVDLTYLLGLGSIRPDEQVLLAELHDRASEAIAVDPFGHIFDAVTRNAAIVYGAHWNQPSLALRWRSGHPRPIADPYGITASAVPNEVRLDIHPHGLSPGAYAVVPWLLVHECICHIPAQQGGKISNSSPFAEGFMDWASGFFFDRWVDSINTPLCSAASQNRELIDPVLTRPETSEGAARIRGRMAAERIVTWLQREHQFNWAQAQAWTARFAVDLNSHSALLAAKDKFVVDLNRLPWSADLQLRILGVLNGSIAAGGVL